MKEGAERGEGLRLNYKDWKWEKKNDYDEKEWWERNKIDNIFLGAKNVSACARIL